MVGSDEALIVGLVGLFDVTTRDTIIMISTYFLLGDLLMETSP